MHARETIQHQWSRLIAAAIIDDDNDGRVFDDGTRWPTPAEMAAADRRTATRPLPTPPFDYRPF